MRKNGLTINQAMATFCIIRAICYRGVMMLYQITDWKICLAFYIICNFTTAHRFGLLLVPVE